MKMSDSVDTDAFNTLLSFAESIANHTSENLHGWYSGEVTAARCAVKQAGGTLKARGRYRENETEPMSFEYYSRHGAAPDPDIQIRRAVRKPAL